MKRLIAVLAVLLTLTACDPTRPPSGGNPPADAPPPAAPPGNAGGYEGGECPPTTVMKFVGVIHAPGSDELIHRPMRLTIVQFNQNGDPGTVRNRKGQDVPGAGFTDTGTSPLTYCLRSVAVGALVVATVSFEIQTNVAGYIVACAAYIRGAPGRFTLMHNDEDEIEGRKTTATATCHATTVVVP